MIKHHRHPRKETTGAEDDRPESRRSQKGDNRVRGVRDRRAWSFEAGGGWTMVARLKPMLGPLVGARIRAVGTIAGLPGKPHVSATSQGKGPHVLGRIPQ